jgi:hypothetical protein
LLEWIEPGRNGDVARLGFFEVLLIIDMTGNAGYLDSGVGFRME